jgi:putative transposase
LPKEARPSTITLTKDPAGRYFVSFLVEEDAQTLPSSPQTVGIDLGLEDVVTLSTGEKTGNEHFFTKDEKRLATLQRRHEKRAEAVEEPREGPPQGGQTACPHCRPTP